MLPYLKYAPAKTTQQLLQFGGINHTENYSAGELADSTNLAADRFPQLSPRKSRGEVQHYDGTVTGMTVKNGKAFAVVELPDAEAYNSKKGYAAGDMVSVEHQNYVNIQAIPTPSAFGIYRHDFRAGERASSSMEYGCLADYSVPLSMEAPPDPSEVTFTLPYWVEVLEEKEYVTGVEIVPGDVVTYSDARYVCFFGHTVTSASPTPDTGVRFAPYPEAVTEYADTVAYQTGDVASYLETVYVRILPDTIGMVPGESVETYPAWLPMNTETKEFKLGEKYEVGDFISIRTGTKYSPFVCIFPHTYMSSTVMPTTNGSFWVGFDTLGTSDAYFDIVRAQYVAGETMYEEGVAYVCNVAHRGTNGLSPAKSPFWTMIGVENTDYWKKSAVGQYLWGDQVVGSFDTRGEKRILSLLNQLVIYPDFQLFNTEVGKLQDYFLDELFQSGYFFFGNNCISPQYQYKGEYVEGMTYYYRDIVEFNGRTYITIQNSTTALPTDTVYWQDITETAANYYTVYVLEEEPFLRMEVLDEMTEINVANGFEFAADRTTGEVFSFALGTAEERTFTARSFANYFSQGVFDKWDKGANPTTDWRDDEAYRHVNSVTYNERKQTVTISYRSFIIKRVGFDLTKLFTPGTSVKISGCEVAEENNDRYLTIKTVSSVGITFTADDLEKTPAKGTDSTGKTLYYPETGQVRIQNSVPDFDCVCAYNNRIFGASGKTIYVSAEGQPFSFYDYSSLLSASYAVDVAGEGKFTACMGYGNYVAFFKEDCVHKLYGDNPSAYQLSTSVLAGVQEGCEKSLCIIEDTLFYKSRHGVYTYTGGSNVCISEKLGRERFSDAVAGTDGLKYYISMKDQNDAYSLYVYDTAKGLWFREDDSCVKSFSNTADGLLFLSGNTVYLAETDTAEEQIAWSATFCPFVVEETPLRKTFQRLLLRCELMPLSYLVCEIKTDNDTRWREVGRFKSKGKEVIDLPIRPRRCDSFELRVFGEGDCRLKSLFFETKIGGTR